MSAFVINSYAFAKFAPTDISGCVAWFDFSDTTTMFTDTGGTTAVSANNDLIARINDKSSGGFDLTQSTSGSRPTYKTNILNSRGIARFADGFLFSSTNFSITGSVNRTFFGVFTKESGTNDNYVISTGDHNTGAATGSGLSLTAEFFIRASFTTKGYTNVGTVGQFGIITMLGNGTTLNGYDLFLNGGSALTANSTNNTTATLNTAAQRLTIGSNNVGSSAASYVGDLAEVIIYDSALSTSDREAVRNYLNAKWAVY